MTDLITFIRLLAENPIELEKFNADPQAVAAAYDLPETIRKQIAHSTAVSQTSDEEVPYSGFAVIGVHDDVTTVYALSASPSTDNAVTAYTLDSYFVPICNQFTRHPAWLFIYDDYCNGGKQLYFQDTDTGQDCEMLLWQIQIEISTTPIQDVDPNKLFPTLSGGELIIQGIASGVPEQFLKYKLVTHPGPDVDRHLHYLQGEMGLSQDGNSERQGRIAVGTRQVFYAYELDESGNVKGCYYAVTRTADFEIL